MLKKQMEMFEEGGLKDEGGTVDPISGNDVPSGSTQEEVRDDIPAQLSEGEFVFPADVVRYLGLEKLMTLRQEAKQGLKTMEDMGQMGNSEEATMRDDMPFDINDIDMEDEEEYNSEDMEMAQGGVVYAATGFGGTVTSAGPNITTKASNFGNTATRTPQPKTYTPPPLPTAAPTGGFKYGATKGAAESKLNFDNLFKDTGAADEYRTYVNDAGAEIQVPFKNGKLMTGFTIPEGYKLKTEKVDTAKTQSTGIKSTRPTQQDDGGDGGDDGSKGGASISFGGTPDPNKPGSQQKAITANVSYNVNALGGIAGIFGGMSKVADINKGLDVETKGNQYGKTTNPVELQFGNGKSIAVTSKVYSTIKSDVYGKTSKEMKDRMEVLNNIATQKDISFDEKTNLYTDSGGRTISQEQAEQAGIDINNHIDSEISKGRSMESIVNSLNNTEVSMAQDVSIEAEDDQQSYSTTTPSVSLSNLTPNNDDDDNNDGGYSDSPSDDNNDSGGFGDMSGMDFNTGGLAGKKKQKTKVKKMKRGGLASR